MLFQFTEKRMMGRMMMPTIARMAVRLAASDSSSMEVRSAISPRYRKNRISTEVRRGSQAQNAPHIGLPHSEPVARHSSVNRAPIGAAALADTSASGWRNTRKPKLEAAMRA